MESKNENPKWIITYWWYIQVCWAGKCRPTEGNSARGNLGYDKKERGWKVIAAVAGY